MPKVAKLLTVKELAALRNVHVSTIRRQLHALDEKSRDGVICARRTGRSPIRTTAAALCRADRTLVEDEATPEERVEVLEKTLRETRATVRQLKDRVKLLTAAFEGFLTRERSRAS